MALQRLMLQKLVRNVRSTFLEQYHDIKHYGRNLYCLTQKQYDIEFLNNSKNHNRVTNENDDNVSHVPVLAKEVLQYLQPSPGKTFVDMTFGAGGHATKILESSPDVKIFALDRDRSSCI